MSNNFSIRDKSILIGLYISKFDEHALYALGFEGMKQAFNTLGYSIGAKPASIKNYRDEFDPYFPNPRKGWHKRQIREYCKEWLSYLETQLSENNSTILSQLFHAINYLRFVYQEEFNNLIQPSTEWGCGENKLVHCQFF